MLPAYGDIDDAAQLIEEAHRAGMRVIADMVMNHTSDQHPWFQESRQDRTNPKADWYVWGDDDQRWSEARVIFVDTEPSNWSFDPQRGQYFWHRFFHHQPDLNYDNPEVADAMLDVVRFWLDLGLDGFRLDAVPYLFERDGTNGENLPETHEYLRQVRKTVDDEFPGRVLLAEANQWPEDVVDYFGADGDECHMCFHFPLMPRMFMAVRREQRQPITEILAQTPDIPDGCQWGIFLRNHDELTLEMVTDEERDYMYAEYAADPRMRRNIGIARRLFPLLDNDQDVVELFHAMLFSMPGSPVLYYGDEIGMGDNIFLGDRDGVRTPMQWTPDRNGGFSTADFAQLYLPPLMDPVYGFQAVNVEAQQRDRVLVPALAAAPAAGAPRAPRVRHGRVRGAARRQPVGARLPPARRGRHRAVRQQPQPLPAALRADARGAGRAWCPSSSPVGCTSRRSASCPTSSPSPPTGSTGSASRIPGKRPSRDRTSTCLPAAADRRAAARPTWSQQRWSGAQDRPVARRRRLPVDEVVLRRRRRRPRCGAWSTRPAWTARPWPTSSSSACGSADDLPEFLHGKEREVIGAAARRRRRRRRLRRAGRPRPRHRGAAPGRPRRGGRGAPARSSSSTRTARWCSTSS